MFWAFPAHHQELNDCSGNLWFYLRIVVIVVLCSWLHRYCYLPLQRLVAVTVWQITDAVDTVVCAPDDGWWCHPKHGEQFLDKINCVTLLLVGYILEHENVNKFLVRLFVKRNENLQNARYTLSEQKCQAVFFPSCSVTDCRWLRMARVS
jgi:hypothetical protein